MKLEYHEILDKLAGLKPELRKSKMEQLISQTDTAKNFYEN